MFFKHKENRILYCAAIPVHLYTLLLHRLTEEKSSSASLIIDKIEYLNRYEIQIINKFKEYGLFDEIYELDLFGVRRKENLEVNGINIEERYINYFNEILSNVDLKKYKKIYAFNDSWDGDINLYFNLKKIKYVWINENKNYIPGIYHMGKRVAEKVKEYQALTPFASCAIPLLRSDSDKIINDISNSKKYYIWDPLQDYEKLEENDVKLVASCFNIPQLIDSKESVLLIKNSGGICEGLAFDGWMNAERWGESRQYVRLMCGAEHYSIDDYTAYFDIVALDYFSRMPKKIYIKEHPNCPLSEEQRLIYQGKINTLTQIPYEFLVKYFEYFGVKFDTIIGYVSTSLSSISSKQFNSLYVLGKYFFRSSFFYASLYTSIKLAEYLEYQNIFASVALCSQFELLSRRNNSRIIAREYQNNLLKIDNSILVIDYTQKGEDITKEFLDRLPTNCLVCFINVELSKAFFPERFAFGLGLISIDKKNQNENVLDFQRNEKIWLYSRSNSLLNKCRSFKLREKLNYSETELVVRMNSYSETAEAFYDLFERSQIKIMSQNLEYVFKMLSIKMPEYILPLVTDLEKYICLLDQIRNRYLILLVIKDTAGDYLSNEMINLIHSLGFSNFTKELWRMYIGVSDCGEILCNEAGETREAPVHYKREGKPALTLSSLAWRQGNKAEILIDGVDYAVNIRGLNIVVYDTQNNKLIDSVGFDYHSAKKKIQRK